MSYIEIKGIKTYFEKKGTKGNDVILLHGWGQNTEMMNYIAEFLKKHFVVYNIDFPGHGQSEEPVIAYGVEDFKDFLREFIEKKKIENPIIIAHSFGCRVAIRYAHEYPVYKMVLTGAAGIRDERHLDYYLKVYSYKAAKKVLSLKPFKKQYDELIKNAGSSDYKNTTGVMRETFVKVVNDDVKDLLKDIDVETLLVFGSNDDQTPVEKGKMMEALMPNASLVIFDNDDHFAYFHQADRFNRVLEAYLREDYD